MYDEFYGFSEPPFHITPNPRFLYFSRQHQEAFDHLVFGVRERKGFIQLTGEVGAGKTTLCRAFLEHLGSSYETALVLNPRLTPTQLMRSILVELGLEPHRTRDACLADLNEFLLDRVTRGRDVVLLIDEAQDMDRELLEEVRLLSNLETDDRKLLQIVLIGQPELRDLLADDALRQLRQRILVRYHLDPLSADETESYIRYRLGVAGANSRPTFGSGALRAIHRYSGGIPRLINAVCDKTLLCGYVVGVDHLTRSHVRRAVRELEGG
ncbi:MAG: AAA family ATPase [Thermoanaerobaculia bacterium]|nr:AAA family ATPase [Thermoanaerobaculia bacterium]